MNYKNLEDFVKRRIDKILPQKGDLSPKNFSSGEETEFIEGENWISYSGNRQTLFKALLNSFCEKTWGKDYSVQILFTVGSMGRSDKLSVWVVPVSKTVGQFI